jgi:hypothetical protein
MKDFHYKGEADETYDMPQYNGASATFFNEGKELGAELKSDVSEEGLSMRAVLIHHAPEGDPIRKTPKGIVSDGAKPDSHLTYVKAEITSPLSGQVIIRQYEDGSVDRFICEKCAEYVAEKGRTHALDPIYYWGAGIYHYKTHKTPKGTKAYFNRKAMGLFIKYLPYELKRDWKDIVGLPFPYLFLQEVSN